MYEFTCAGAPRILVCLSQPVPAVGNISMQITTPHESTSFRWRVFLPSFLGLDENGIRQILKAARKKANLSYFNGMELASLRAEGSNELDLSG